MGQRLVAAHQVMLDCLALPECIEDADRPGHSVVDADVMARSHLIAMFPVTDYVAEAMLSLAADLHFRYPAILKAMLDGRMDLAAAKVLAEQMSTVDDEFVLRVQQEVVDDYLDAVESGKRPTRKAIRSRIDEIISRRDRAAVRERKADAGRDRGVSISKGRDGMSSLYAQLRADEAAVLAEALENKVAADKAAEDAAAEAVAAAEAAQSANTADASTGSDAGNPFEAQSAQSGQPGRDGDEPYSHKQRMADALMSFVCGDATTAGDTDPDSGAASGNASDTTGTGTGTDTSTGSDAGTGTGTDAGAGAASAAAAGGSAGSVVLRPKVTIIAPAGHGRWFDRAHVEFARSGEAALLAVLDMLAASDAASIQYLDPATGVADDPDQALRYRPGTALATRIRMRDGSCRHPGCTVKIEACDLDHVVPFNHDDPAAGGQTVESNLVALCRKHHRFKTFNDWQYRLDGDGTLTITTTDGQVMTTYPDGPLAQYRREEAEAEQQAWDRQQRRNFDPAILSAHGRYDPCDYVEQTSWTKREAGKQYRRRKQRGQTMAAIIASMHNDNSNGGAGVQDPNMPWPGFSPIRASTRPGVIDTPPHRHSRWWLNNRHRFPNPGTGTGDGPHINPNSAIELALHTALQNHLNPPPF